MSSPEKDKVISAIKSLGRKVTVADVSAKSGLPLLVSGRLLNKVAADCRGTIQVTNDGKLVYAFAPAFDTAYLAAGFAGALAACTAWLLRTGFFLLRISFGVTLIISLLTVGVLIAIAVIAMMKAGSSSGGGNNSSSSSNVDAGNFLLDMNIASDIGRFFCWNLSYSTPYIGNRDYSKPSYESDYEAYTQGRYIPQSQRDHEGAQKDQGFILNCFSYLFGDGNPNAKLEEQKWHTIAEHIRSNKGVTTAEQLSAYTGADPKREYGALPVLVRFDGQPVVTDTGNVLYVFPSLQFTATQPGVESETVPDYLQEKRWEFSNQPASRFLSVGLFAVLNFAGCMWLFGHATAVAALHPYTILIEWLSLYALFFLLFPLVRQIVLLFINLGIYSRNKKRQANRLYALQNTQKKLAEAQAFAIEPDKVSNNQIVYSTDKDLLEQQFDN